MVANIVLLEALMGSVFTPNVSIYKFPRVPTSNSDKEFQTARRKWINFVQTQALLQAFINFHFVLVTLSKLMFSTQ